MPPGVRSQKVIRKFLEREGGRRREKVGESGRKFEKVRTSEENSEEKPARLHGFAGVVARHGAAHQLEADPRPSSKEWQQLIPVRPHVIANF